MMKNIAFQVFFVNVIFMECFMCFEGNGVPQSVYIGFTNTSLSVAEGAGHVQVCIIKAGMTYFHTDVLLFTLNNTAKAERDYSPVYNKTISFSPAVTNITTCYLQNITDNNITEYNKTFYVNMTTRNPYVTLVPDRSILTITILNDDKVTVEFEQEALVVEEDAEEGDLVLVCQITAGVALVPIHLDFEVNSDEALVTAESGLDFTLKKDKSFFFAPGETRMNVTVEIKRDGDSESAEVFSVTIKSLDEWVSVVGEKRSTFVKILDSSDIAKGVALKQKQEKEDEKDKPILLYMPIAVVATSFILALLGITFVYCLFRKKVKKAAEQKQ